MKKLRLSRKWKKRLPLIIAGIVGLAIGVLCVMYDAYGITLWSIGCLSLSFSCK